MNTYKEKSKAEEVREFVEQRDEGLIDVLLSGKEKEEPRLKMGVTCPLCQSDTIEITETAEGDSERCFFQMHCVDCGCDFVLFEDDVERCRRGIENAQNEIEYNKNKIEYFNKKLREG